MNKNKGHWNRTHYFAKKKSTRRQVGHPVYVYAKKGRYSKYLTFTHKPEEDNPDRYELLRHNIDPLEDGIKPTYVKKYYDVSYDSNLCLSDKKYRIHEDDKETIKKYKK